MLKSIEEHNKDILDKYNSHYKTGVACPNCGTELQFITNIEYMSNPPQKDVQCYNCAYLGRIYV